MNVSFFNRSRSKKHQFCIILHTSNICRDSCFVKGRHPEFVLALELPYPHHLQMLQQLPITTTVRSCTVGPPERPRSRLREVWVPPQHFGDLQTQEISVDDWTNLVGDWWDNLGVSFQGSSTDDWVWVEKKMSQLSGWLRPTIGLLKQPMFGEVETSTAGKSIINHPPNHHR